MTNETSLHTFQKNTDFNPWNSKTYLWLLTLDYRLENLTGVMYSNKATFKQNIYFIHNFASSLLLQLKASS